LLFKRNPGKIRYENGCIEIPQNPGLGVTVDIDFIEKYRIAG
jgi:L-alanine-DL-glutamate epimerase-like enolase superfamily enzyme